MTIETEDVVVRLRRKQDGYPQTGRGTIDATGRGTVEMDPAPQVLVNPDGPAGARVIQSLSDRIAVAVDALEAIKEFADADETQLCWKTANDALASLIKEGTNG